MKRLQLRLHLESDTTFGRGEGLAGLVDEEIEYDVATGLPFVRGRMLKGLLVEECANLLFALQKAGSPALSRLQEAAEWLFGSPGGALQGIAHLHIGPALLPQQLRKAVCVEIEQKRLKPADVLKSLTAIRRQTALDEQRAAPEEGSLRSMRVLLRQTSLRAWLDFAPDPEEDDLALLAACTLSVRRAGIGRNRGRGRVRLHLLNEQGSEDTTTRSFERFQHLLRGEQR
ncbi:MAG TPA: RAMP superfamily CRISPR-associated protein [Ktedonobacteraceae bacterium]|nr:RAMP superfamily CRISPR-associated protein [Ktedonobacteraceae bacterium]